MNEKRFSLDELPPTDVFGTPAGYFEDLPMRIQKRVGASSSRPAARPLNIWWRRAWLSAAGASLVAALLYLSIPTRQETLGQETLSLVGRTDIVGYLNERNLTPHDLRYLISTSTAEDAAAQLQELDTLSPIHQLDISDEDIQQHLSTQDIRDFI